MCSSRAPDLADRHRGKSVVAHRLDSLDRGDKGVVAPAGGVFGDDGEREIAVRMAKALASDALAFASDRAIQFHGGFGFTYDCDAQLYRRRGIWCESQCGDAAYQRKRLASLIL